MSPRTVLVALATLALVLTASFLWAMARLREGPSFGAPAVESEELRDAAVRRLVAQGTGLLDTDADPDVGRRLLPELQEREAGATTVTTSSWGLREREVEEKAAGALRVVLLGDDLVFGLGVDADARMGAHLERFLGQRAGDVPVECLHVGVPGWNVRAEASFARRSIEELDADLVVHLVRPDDLGDVRGVRGFGAHATFSPQVRSRACGVLGTTTEPLGDAAGAPNHLPLALDAEGRARYADAADQIERLACAVRAAGGRYLLVSAWTGAQPRVREHFAPRLEDDELAFVSDDFARDPATRLEEVEGAWSPAAHETLARLLYGLIRERDLLAGVDLAAWPEAAAAVAELHGGGVEDARDAAGLRRRVDELRLASTLELDRLEPGERRQLYGGFFSSVVAPYASLVLARGGGDELVVRGERLGRPELVGRAHVCVEGLELGSWELAGDGSIELRAVLPESLRERAHLNVRFESDDFVYLTKEGDGASFRLTSVAIE